MLLALRSGPPPTPGCTSSAPTCVTTTPLHAEALRAWPAGPRSATCGSGREHTRQVGAEAGELLAPLPQQAGQGGPARAGGRGSFERVGSAPGRGYARARAAVVARAWQTAPGAPLGVRWPECPCSRPAASIRCWCGAGTVGDRRTQPSRQRSAAPSARGWPIPLCGASPTRRVSPSAPSTTASPPRRLLSARWPRPSRAPSSAPVTTAITPGEPGRDPGPAGRRGAARRVPGVLGRRPAARPDASCSAIELTTWSLRSESGPSVARDLYDSFHATVEGFVDAVARTCGVTWSVPVPLLARTVVATTTGVRLAWLVDHDEEAAQAALELRRPARRPGPLSSGTGARRGAARLRSGRVGGCGLAVARPGCGPRPGRPQGVERRAATSATQTIPKPTQRAAAS